MRVQLVSKPAAVSTGLGRYAFEITKGLQAAGVDVREAVLRTPVPRLLVELGRRTGYDPETILRSYPIRADVQRGYITHLTSQTLASLLMSQRVPRPVVITVHDIFPYLLRNDLDLRVYGSRLEQHIDRLALRALRRADRLIAISHFTKQTVVEALGIRPEQVDVVHNGVDTNRFRPRHVPEEFRERYGITPGLTFMLYVGTEDPRKNFPLLLRALSYLRSEHDDQKFMLLKVGAPAFAQQRVQHERMCAELGISETVRWLDEVPEADLPLIYNAVDVFTFPSRFEGFGLPVLEALASGTPVVALRSSSIPELIESQAILVDAPDPAMFAAAIRQAAGQSDSLVQARVAHASHFTWERTIHGLMDVYARLWSEYRLAE